jgi:hypothetical protein
MLRLYCTDMANEELNQCCVCKMSMVVESLAESKGRGFM